MSRFLILAVIAALVATGSHAQGLMNTFRDIGLSNEDFGRLRTAEKSLYTVDSPVIGSKAIWKNEETRSHGEVELKSVEERCATVEHVFRVGSTSDVHKFNSRRCRAEDGRWLIAPME